MYPEKKQTIKSPVTGGKAELVETLDVSRIIEDYRKLLNLDVQKYFDGLEEIGIYKCEDTGYRFYYPDTIFADESFYALLQEKDFYYSDWNWEHAVALKNLDTGSKILEVGCGTGSFLFRLIEKGFDCTGLELNEAAVNVCKAKGLSVHNELLETHITKHAGQYDAVCAFQVLEHVYDIRTFINECLQCLKPGGKLIFGVPNNNPYFYKYDKYHTLNLPPHHSGLWNKKAFQKLPAFFPLNMDKVAVEPLLNRDFFITVYTNHMGIGGLYKKIRKIGPGIINRLLWPMRFFVKGKTIVAIFNKHK